MTPDKPRSFMLCARDLEPGNRLMPYGERIGLVHTFEHPSGYVLTEITMAHTEKTLTFDADAKVVAW
jgi:hypothetical protein